MGVLGLTTYIARNSDRYLKPHELHDTYLVIDGNNLAAQLYKWYGKCYDCFGGDYDVYGKVITDFFDVLKKCNVTPLVIFDGSYEDKKLRTIYNRVKSRYVAAKRCCAATEGSVQIFPLFLRELFTETVKRLGVKAMRCDFEADYEMACIARTLNCPVLSYDSDFFIFDVLYIPFSTVNIQSRRVKKKTGSYYVVECKLYKIENFLDSLGGMSKSNLPLLAVLLGNDYIKKSVFSNFYKQLKLITKKNQQSDSQRKIETVIKWLCKETYESAAKKVLGRVKMANRKTVASQIKEVADGYICTKSKLLPFFDISVEPTVAQEQPSLEIDVDSIVEEHTGDNSSDDDDDDSNSVNSDDSLDIGEPTVLEIDMLNEHFPQWFLKEYRNCNFPAWFIDIAVHNRYFFVPQVDNYGDKHSHEISIKLLAHLHKLLTSGKKDNLTYIARFSDVKIRNHLLPTSTLDLPTLEEITNLDVENRKDTLLKILELNENVNEVLGKFPEDWHVFILGIIYWVKNSEVKISNNHIYALLMCALIIKIADKKLGYCRTLKLAQKYEREFQSQAGVDEPDDKGISKRDCLNYLKEMIPYFYMDEKMVRNPRIFDIHIIDAFARFQSCLYHIKYNNKVLNKPLQDMFASDFYNGTCIYGIFSNLNKRADAMAYLRNLLSDAKGILEYFTTLSSTLTEYLNTVEVSTGKKRRKRKNRNKSNGSEEDKKVMCMDDDDGEEGVLDENNQYSILNFV